MIILESEEEEQLLSSVLQRLQSEVKRRQLLVYPYLQDFDRVTGVSCDLVDHALAVIEL